MKKLFAVPVAALVAVGLVACSESPTESFVPQFELVDEDLRIAAEDVNAHVYGSFSIEFTVAGEGGNGAILSGPANFPGNPKNAGTCNNGLWVNAQGKPTSGNIDKPHPHCIGQTQGESTTVYVVLEPISAKYDDFGTAGQELALANSESEGSAYLTGSGKHSRGEGIVVGYAIDASTLGTTNRRVGTLTFDMAQYHHNDRNYFEEDCTIGSETAPRCLNLVILADYEPLPGPDGVGELRSDVAGFLYWSAASVPFNYGS